MIATPATPPGARGLGPALCVVGSVVVLGAVIVSGADPRYALPVVLLVATATLARSVAFKWPNLVATLLVIILFVPIRRYRMPGNLPFQLEPYRLFIALLALAWISSLLIDSRVRIRKSGMEGPLALYTIAVVGSALVNPHRLGNLGVTTDVIKAMTFYFSFLLVFFIFVSVIRNLEHLVYAIKVLVGGGAVLAVLGLIEASTQFNAFDYLDRMLPFLQHERVTFRPETLRGGRLRIVGPAEHPIALSAAFVMLLCLSIYLAKTTKQRRWAAASVLLALGVVSTESRTGITMLLAALFVFLRLRGAEVRRLWPAIIPVLLVVHLAAPGAVGSLKASFFPKGGIVAQEQAGQGTYGSGRLADLGPALHEYKFRPLLGEGYGSRIPDPGPKQNANILDDEWLGTLLETGAVGVLAWVWIFLRFTRKMKRAARTHADGIGWLCTALAAGVTAFAVGMFTYDAFSFIQVSFLLYIFMALGCVGLNLATERRATVTP